MARFDQLVVWMNGERVGVWSQARGGAATFAYDADWGGSPAGRVLSLSLPFTPGNEPHRGAAVTSFFDNLLPDSDSIRARLRAKFAADSTGAFDLLAVIGRDCVGAVQLLPDGEAPSGFDRVDAEALSDAEVEHAINSSLSAGRVLGHAGEEEDLRLSLAGAQEKTAFLRYRNRWCRPKGATPTSHIFKLPLGMVGNMQADMQDSVENEWLCSRLMSAFGLETASCEIAQFGERKVLVVERFDRAWQNSRWLARRPQEDFCQALGVPSHRKYESDGGPGMAAILRILTTSSQAEADKRAFIKAQMVFWLLAATDGHAKNFSIFHERGGSYRLTPFYDVLSAWPIIGNGPKQLAPQKARLAMAVRSKNPHWKIQEIQPRHWDEVTRIAGLGKADALRDELIALAPAVVAAVSHELPRRFPEKLAEAVFAGLLAQAKRLAS